MAAIKNSMSMEDRMSPVLKSMLKAMDSVLKVMEQMDKATNAGQLSKGIQQAERDVQKASNTFIKMGNDAARANQQVQTSTEKSIRQLNALELAARGIKFLGGAVKNRTVDMTKGWSMSGALSSAFSGAQNLGTKMMGAASFTKNLDIDKFLNSAQAKVSAGMATIGNIATRSLSRVSGAFGVFGSAASRAFASARPALMSFGTALASLGSRVSNLGRIITTPFRALIGVGGTVISTFGNIGSRIMTTLSPVLSSVSARAQSVFSRIGSGASTAFSVAKNSVVAFGSAVNNAFTNLTNRMNMTWTSMASGIYVLKNIIGLLGQFTQIADQVTGDVAKLGLYNNSNITNTQAYGMAYQVAEDSRSDISATSQLAQRIAMSGVYGQGEGTLESAINTAGIINKAMVLGGGSSEENKRAILQLSQGLSSGVLQGDELRSIREQSPYFADILAQGLAKVDDDFIGTTAGDLKQLGSEGKLTSDIVIKALEAMEDQIDATFEEKAPKTWAQGVTSIMNTVKMAIAILQQMEGGPLQKISAIIWTIADWLKSTEGMQVLAGIAVVLGVIADVLNFVINAALSGISWLMDNLHILIAIFVALGIVALIAGIQAMIAWIAAIWPILLLIAIIAIVIWAFMQVGFTVGEIVGAIAGSFTWVAGLIYNVVLAIIGFFKGMWNAIKAIATNIGIAFNNAISGVQAMFWGLLSTVMEVVAKIANTLNKLPFVSIDVEGLWGKADEFAAKKAEAEGNMKAYEDVSAAFEEGYDSMGAFQEGWSSEWFNKGYEWGSDLVDGAGDTLGQITDAFGNLDALSAGMDVNGAEVAVGGGNLDSVDSIGSDVDISDEDIQLLRDMAARDYLLQLQSITPVANVTFGDVRETADVNKIVEVIEQMVDEQMATALVS